MGYFFAAFIVALGSLGAVATQTKFFLVESVPVQVQIVNSGSIENTLQQHVTEQIQSAPQLYKNRKIWAVSLGKIQKAVTQNPWVNSVRISRTLPNHINVVVEPKRAVAILLVSKAKGAPPEIRALTADGGVLKLPSQTTVLDVPVARGLAFATDEKARAQLVQFIDSLPQDGSLSTKNIAEITYKDDDGFSLSLIPSKATVVLGSENTQTKVSRVSKVLDYLTAHQLRGRVIDASFSKKVLVRLRKDP
jgi:cell division septal protein FtsQ